MLAEAESQEEPEGLGREQPYQVGPQMPMMVWKKAKSARTVTGYPAQAEFHSCALGLCEIERLCLKGNLLA